MALCRDIDLLEVKIVNDRLILRPTSLFDLDPIFRNFNERVTRFMFPSPAISSVETASFITDSIDAMLDRTNLHLTILHSDPSRGARGFITRNLARQRSESGWPRVRRAWDLGLRQWRRSATG